MTQRYEVDGTDVDLRLVDSEDFEDENIDADAKPGQLALVIGNAWASAYAVVGTRAEVAAFGRRVITTVSTRGANAPTYHVLDVVASHGVPFRVVAYPPGATGPYPAARDETRAIVEFYDRRYAHTEHGQFTGGRYRVSNLLDDPPRGLMLHGGVSDWAIDPAAMDLVLRWLTSLGLR